MQHISAIQLKQLLFEFPSIYLLDVREDFEHEYENIGGVLFPLGEVTNHAHEIPTNAPVIVYCRKGVRSQIAIQKLEAKFGFTNLINLDGGIEAWKKLDAGCLILDT